MIRRKKKRVGSGSVEKLPSGKFRAVLPGRVRKGRTKTFETQAEGWAWIRRHADRNSVHGTLGAWLERWLEMQWANTAPSTHARDEIVCRTIIVPDLGTVSLSDITANTINNWLAALKKRGKSDDARHRAWETLRKALRSHADLPNANWEKVKAPKVVRPERRSLTPEQFRNLVQYARTRQGAPAFLPAMLLVWLEGCLRPREMLALQWRDILPTSPGLLLSVRRALCPETGEIKELKTERSKRDVPLSQAAELELGAWHGVQDPDVGMDKPLFPGTDGRQWPYSTFRKFWSSFVAEAGLPGWTAYEIRHSGCSILISAGESVLAVARRMGHVDASLIFKTYGHLLPNDQQRLTSVFEKLYNQPSGCGNAAREDGCK